MLSTEQALAALLDSLQAALGSTFLTYGRRLKYWTNVGSVPALFLNHTADDDSWSGEGLPKTIVTVKAWIYAKTGPDDVPDTVLNGLALALAQALAPDDPATGEFTLGGLVSWCRIEGETEFWPGDVGDKAIAIVPIRMLLTV